MTEPNGCESMRAAAMALADDESSVLSLEQIQQHLQGCSECRAALERAADLSVLFDGLQRKRHEVDVLPRLSSRITSHPAVEKPRRSLWIRRSVLIGSAVSLLLIVVCVSVGIVLRDQSPPISNGPVEPHASGSQATPKPYDIPYGPVKQIDPDEFYRRYVKYFEEDYQRRQQTELRNRADADHWRPSIVSSKQGPLGTLFIDDEGQVTLAAKYPLVGPFIGGFAVVGTTVSDGAIGDYGCIDKTGRLVIAGDYDLVGEFSDGLAPVQKDGKWGYINRKGEMAISLRYNEWAFAFRDGVAQVAPDNKTTQFIDTSGKVLFEFDVNIWNAGHFSEGLVFANLPVGGVAAANDPTVDQPAAERVVGYLDRQFQFAFRIESEMPGDRYFLEGREFHGGMAAVAIGDKTGTRWGFISRDGKLAIESEFFEVHPFSEDLAAVSPKTTSLPKWGFVDKNGDMVIEAKFLGALDFHEGVAAVLVLSDDDEATSPIAKWGFVDKTGELIIEPRFFSAMSFQNGLARVQDNPWSHGYINVAGEYVWRLDEPTYGFDKKTVISKSDQLKLVAENQRGAATELQELGMSFEVDDQGGVTYLQLSGQRINDAQLSRLKALTTLKSLSISSAPVTDSGLRRLAAFKQLQNLNLSRCDGVTDSGLSHLKQLTTLDHLGIAYCRQVTDDGLQHLQDLTNMKMLTFNSLNITDAGLRHLRKMTRLERLYIYDTPISGSGLEHLTDLKSLKYLLLRGCPITDSGVIHVRQFPSLTLLDLSGSSSSFELQVTSEAIDQLKSALPQLKVNR